MSENITRREALKRFLAGGSGLLLAASGLSPLLSACTSKGEEEMRRKKAEADAPLLTGCQKGCTDCMPCPYGVAIPEVFQNYDKAIAEGRLPDPAREKPKLLQHDAETYKEQMMRIPRLAQADRCIGCHKCASRCPKHIDIELTLRRIEDIEEVVRELTI